LQHFQRPVATGCRLYIGRLILLAPFVPLEDRSIPSTCVSDLPHARRLLASSTFPPPSPPAACGDGQKSLLSVQLLSDFGPHLERPKSCSPEYVDARNVTGLSTEFFMFDSLPLLEEERPTGPVLCLKVTCFVFCLMQSQETRLREFFSIFASVFILHCGNVAEKARFSFHPPPRRWLGHVP